MNAPRVLYHMVRADFLERVRRYSFLLTLAFAVYLGYAAFAGKIIMRLGEYRGIYNSAWLGSLMALVGGMFLSLVGFYIVKNSIQRDQDTRVGSVLATTPMSKSFYTLAKTASNFAVLASMVMVMAAATLFMQFFRAEDPGVNLWALLSPLVLLGFPTMAFTAALAVFFETLPVLRSGMGNVIFFFVWTALLVAPAVPVFDRNAPLPATAYVADFTGIVSTLGQMQNAVRRVDPAYGGGASLTIGDSEAPPAKRFVWNGLAWNRALILGRIGWSSLAIVVALLAAVFFHRFDPAREWGRKNPKPPAAADPETETPAERTATQTSAAHLSLSPLSQTRGKVPLHGLVAAELRLMLKGKRWWWYLVAAGLSLAALLMPRPAARGGVLIAAWVWPLFVWSPMGSREARHCTESLVFSSARALTRQLPAVWCAGVLVAILSGGGVGLRLLFAGDGLGLAAWLAGAFFIPSLALALGVWSGRSKAFEAIYIVWWYIGPAHHIPGLDFMGTTPASSNPVNYALAAAILLAVSYWGRRARLGYA
jgi:hypothetical protein